MLKALQNYDGDYAYECVFRYLGEAQTKPK